jgi:hypothetical protein
MSVFRACHAHLIGAYNDPELAWPVNHMPIRIANFLHPNGEVTMKSRSTGQLAVPREAPFFATRPVSGGNRGILAPAYPRSSDY